MASEGSIRVAIALVDTRPRLDASTVTKVQTCFAGSRSQRERWAAMSGRWPSLSRIHLITLASSPFSAFDEAAADAALARMNSAAILRQILEVA
jgi:hypothetical protein